MKKFLSLVLVLTLVLSLGAVAFAEPGGNGNGDDGHVDWSPITINKEVKLTNEDSVNPAETFSFTVGTGTVTNSVATSAPAFSPATFTIELAQGALTGSTDIVLPEFVAVGIYTYPITEAAGNTAGMTYDAGTYNLVVTVINDPDSDGFIRVLTLTDDKNVKTDAFENTFSAGNLVITKEITGNYAVYTDEFVVTVTLTPAQGKNIKEGPISVTGAVGNVGTVVKNAETGIVTVTFKVTNESGVTIANIPYGVSYAVSEAANPYTADIENASGTINAASQTVAITNTLDTEIQAGVNLDNLPFVLLLVGAVVGLFGFTMKRRLASNR